MKIQNITGTLAGPPKGMSLKATLAWEYLFGDTLTAVKTDAGQWICFEGTDLDNAFVFQNDEDFIKNELEVAADDYLDDPKGFLSTFVTVPGLMTDEVANAMMNAISDGEEAVG